MHIIKNEIQLCTFNQKIGNAQLPSPLTPPGRAEPTDPPVLSREPCTLEVDGDVGPARLPCGSLGAFSDSKILYTIEVDHRLLPVCCNQADHHRFVDLVKKQYAILTLI